jgi:DNA segregation ATPase FtsK/SpoIIIE, S-DNA-T family
MLELLAFPLAMTAVALIPSGGKNDKKKIQRIFENVGYGVRKKNGEMEYPYYRTKYQIKERVLVKGQWENKVIGTCYRYDIPLGLPATKMAKLEKDIRIFTDGLKKPVEIEYKQTLNISVYHEELPEMVEYGLVPYKKSEWVVPLGRSVQGFVYHNFDHTPHMTVAGTTRFGKTVFLRMLMTYLIECHGDDVEFYIIDLKGGLEFGPYESIRQVKGVAANPFEAAEMLSQIMGNVDNDYQYFRKKGYSNVVDTHIQKRRFIIVDEAAQLAPEKWMKKDQKDVLGFCQYTLGEIARIAGALGYREIFCTQYPTADTLPRSIKQNADAKISFRLPSGYASEVAIDDRGAEELPSNVKGRALFKTHELKELQVPYLSHEEMWGRLEKYQEPRMMEGVPEHAIDERREAPKPKGGNFVQFHES